MNKRRCARAALWPLLAAIPAALSTTSRAESLQDVYDAARGYDATFLSARALHESNVYRAAQNTAGILPQVAFGAGAIVAISAPTTLALERARAHGMTLVAVARADGALLFTDAAGVSFENLREDEKP